MAIHIGSWGTPEFNITETLSNLFGQGRTSQGGSNLFGPVSQTTLAPQPGGGFAQTNVTGVGYQLPRNSGTTGGSSGTQTQQAFQPTQQSGQSNGYSMPSYEDQMRSSINSGWDAYEGQLNSMLNNDLPAYRGEQQQIAQNSADLAQKTIGTQKASSERAVNEQQTSSLKDLGENMRNLFQAGNIFLGSRGAADSSAANQYSYGLTKVGAKERGNILSQANSRLNQIKDIYDTETNRIGTELQLRMGQIADWFYTQQQNLKSSLASSGLNRQKDLQGLSTNLYNQALSYLQGVQSEAANRRATLESWAASNSKTAQELVANLQQVQQMPAFQGIQSGMPSVDSSGNYQMPVAAGYGSTSTTKKDIFGNPIS